MTNDKELAEKAYSFQSIGRAPGRPFYEFHRVASNLRMTEWQGAVLLGQLSRLDAQLDRRERNATYLAEGLREIDGIEPIKRSKRVTRWGFYYWNFRYDQERFDGIHRDVFMKALSREGVPVGIGAHGMPLYQNPLFESMNFGRTGCPIKCPLYGRKVDFRKVRCPNSEHVFTETGLRFNHRLFLGPRRDMDCILRAVRKIRENTDELRRVKP